MAYCPLVKSRLVDSSHILHTAFVHPY